MTPWDGQPKFEGEVPKPVATRVSREPSGRLRRVKPSEVVVSRTDLEWALRLIENVHTVTWPNAKDVPYVEFDRLRAVLNTENQT